MNSRQMEYVLAVAEEHSFSKAAKRLLIAQPSLSQYIQNVEKELGAVLFDRAANPLQLTQAGEIYVKTAREILNLELQMHQQLEDLENLKTGRLRVGISPYLSSYLMPAVFARFYQQFPGMDIALHEDITAELEKKLVSGEIELALTTFLPEDNPKLHYISLLREDMLLAVPEQFCDGVEEAYEIKGGNWPVTRLENFQHIPFVTLKSNQLVHKLLMELCRKSGFTPKIRLECRNLEAAHAMAAAGIGATLIPYTLANLVESGARNLGNLRYYRLMRLFPEREMGAIYRKGRYVTKAMLRLIDITQELLETVAVRPDPFAAVYPSFQVAAHRK